MRCNFNNFFLIIVIRIIFNFELNVQPNFITDFRGLNAIYPSYWYWLLVILAKEDFVLNRVNNRIVLLLIYVNPHDLDAHTATHPATFQVIVCHRLSGLSGNCQGSRLLREQAKIWNKNEKLFFFKEYKAL